MSSEGGDMDIHTIKGTTLGISARTFVCNPYFMIIGEEKISINKSQVRDIQKVNKKRILFTAR